LHLSLYTLDQHFDLFKVASEIVLRIYLLIGALALTGLIALAATSTTPPSAGSVGALECTPQPRLPHRTHRRGALLHAIQGRHLRACADGRVLVWLLAYRASTARPQWSRRCTSAPRLARR